MKSIGIVILAAGSSSRMGKTKQMLPIHGTTFLQHSIHVAMDSLCRPIVVVLPCTNDIAIQNAHCLPIQIIENPESNQGMSSSIRIGINTISSLVSAAILMACDQPFVSPCLLQQLCDVHQNTKKPLIASSYAGTYGIPALFSSSFFPDLLQLKGDTGAKSILKKNLALLETVPFPQGAVDIDTWEDFLKFQP